MQPLIRLPIPTPYQVGPVNCYLIDARPRTLVDPGPNTKEAQEALAAGLAGAGVRLEQVERIVITHGHSDHASLAGWVRNQSGAPILAHPYEFPKLTGGFNIWLALEPFLRAGGMPGKVRDYLRATVDPVPPMHLAPSDLSPLGDGECLPAGDLSLKVLHLPGHSVGHLGLFEPRRGDFLAGDFLLPDITPNPVMEPDPLQPGKRARSLPQYLACLDRVAALEVRTVWPGHGEPFGDFRRLIDQIREHHVRRKEYILSLVGEDWVTPYQLTGVVYPDLDDYNIFLGFSEVAGHLDLLEEQGRLVRREDGGVVSFRRAKLTAKVG